MYIICFRSVKENVIPDDKEEFSLRLAMRNIFQNQPLLCVQLSNVACLLAMTLRGYLNYYYCMYNLGNLTIEVVNTVGCGDSMLGAFAVAVIRAMSAEESIRYAVAVGTANALSPSTGSFDIKEMQKLLPQVQITRL